MLRLHQTFGAHTGRTIDLDRDIVRFGRLPDNEVAFDPHADLDASGRHAEIRKEGAQWVLVDVGSRNGTLVAGQRITRHVLTSGEEIEFGVGGPRLRIEFGPASVSASKQTAAATPVSAAGGYQTGPATPLSPSVDPPSNSHAPAISALPHPTPPPSPFQNNAPSGNGLHAPLTPPPQQHLPGNPTPHPTPLMGQMTPVGPPSEKKYGQRTVGMMIQAALQQADSSNSQGGRGSTDAMRAVATEAARKSSRGVKIVLVLVMLLLMLTLGAVAALFFWGNQQEQQLRDENVRLQQELTELGEGESDEREALEERIQSLNDQLGEHEEATGSSIAERHDGAVWALVRTAGSRRNVICSAFAVRADLLATSAHCVNAVERALGRGDVVRAVANRGVGEPLVIQQMFRHPQYQSDAPASPDVGLMRIAGVASSQCQIATMTELNELGAGDDVFVLGFPGVLAATGAPVAGMTTGVIGRVTAFDGTSVPAVRRHLVSHSAFSDDGTAGSPIFDRDGRVIAINAGNMRTRRRVTDTGTHVTRTIEGDAPYAWAVRADLLLQLLAGMPR